MVLSGLALAALAGCERRVTELELIEPALDIDRSIAERIAERLNAEGPLRIRLIPRPADGRTTLDALEGGYGHLAFASNDQAYRDGIATIMPLYPTVLHVITTGDRPPDDIRSLLEDATVFAGPQGSASRALAERIVRLYELDPASVQFVDAPDTLPDVVVLYAPIHARRIRSDARLRGATMLSFGSPADIGRGSTIDRALLFNPSLRPFIVPVGTYGDLTPEPTVTLAVDKLLVARRDLPDALAYDLVGEILRLRPALAGDRPELFRGLSDDFDTAGVAFALHPGALSYLQRDAPTFIERYSGVAEVLVTLLIGAVSGTFAVVKIYRIRRKNRIDRYYTEVIAIRDAVPPGSGDAERNDAVRRIRALQNEAFAQLVDEKLAADESFRIFITLADDAIRDLGDGSARRAASES